MEFDCYIENDTYEFRTKDGIEFEYYTFDGWGWESDMNQYLETIKECYEDYVEPKQEESASTTDKLLEVIHDLEKRIEDLEADRSTLVLRANDILVRLNSAKLTI